MFNKNIKLILASYLKQPEYLVKNIKWRFPKKHSKLSIVFVIGAPRSGTTLLQNILASHSKYFSIKSETGFFLYHNIFDPKKRYFGYSRSELNEFIKNSSDIIEFFETCIYNLDNFDQHKRFIEKTPNHILHLNFLMKYFENGKFIHIVRDGRDCYCSSKNNKWVPQQKSPKIFAKYWRKCVKNISTNMSNERLKTIKYENLVSNPEYSIKNIMHFLGDNIEISQLDPKVYGNDPRARDFAFNMLNKKINSCSVQRWKKELTKEEIEIFDNIAGKELSAFGYTDNT
jgi:hypothetical protein